MLAAAKLSIKNEKTATRSSIIWLTYIESNNGLLINQLVHHHLDFGPFFGFMNSIGLSGSIGSRNVIIT